MAFKLTRPVKRTLIFMFAYGFVALVVVGYFQYKYDRTKANVTRALESMGRCRQLGLRMERQDVLQIMGPAVKEYDVRPSGKGSEVLYHEMLFRSPTPTMTPPYVDVDIASNRVIEIFCSEHVHLVLSANARLELSKQNSQALPSAQ